MVDAILNKVLDLKRFFLWIGYRKISSLVWNMSDHKQG